MLLDNKITITKINPSEADMLSQLCFRIYPQFFTYLWYDQGQWYQQEKYNAIQLKKEIENPNSDFYIASTNMETWGYLKINKQNTLPLYPSTNGLEVERIYLLKEAQGKGIGKTLMDFVFSQAEHLGKDYIFLYVMDSSIDSIKFYQKMGFEKFGTKKLDFVLMKEEYRGMYSMVKSLKK
jgi:ribosomal protein S18 acetylase RimI-like enzyme